MSGIWDPNTYLQFAAYRARPADDLISHLSLAQDGAIYDLGCGPGNLTVKLKDRWTDRDVTGLDSSADMLEKAQQHARAQNINWTLGDIATWSAPEAAALVFANASLQWLGTHEVLFPRLLASAQSGGILAVQMPMTTSAPYHKCIRDVAALPKWRDRLKDAKPHPDEYPAQRYYEILRPLSTSIDIWETTYHHILSGENPVIEWMSGAGLTPVLSQLDGTGRSEFLDDYSAAISPHYPREKNGETVFAVRRIFIVAQRA